MNRRVLLASRPTGLPRVENFAFDSAPIPEPGAGEVLVENIWLSIDPFIRGRMNAGPSYARAMEIGEVVVGGTVGRVIRSNVAALEPGDLVQGQGCWQQYSALRVADASELEPGVLPTWKLDPQAFPARFALSTLGMPGLTAYVGLHDIGQLRSQDTVVVSSASGAVGSVVGQLAKIAGARVIGIAGGPQKCSFVAHRLGFDAGVDYKAPDFEARLRQACPHGIDLYFDNVGGTVTDACMSLLNTHGRVVLCGQTAHYNMESLPPGPDRSLLLRVQILLGRLNVRGFIVSDHWHRREQFLADAAPLVTSGRLQLQEHIAQGLDAAPGALIDLLQGNSFGKVLIQIAPESGE